jgi:hypothetical protein
LASLRKKNALKRLAKELTKPAQLAQRALGFAPAQKTK